MKTLLAAVALLSATVVSPLVGQEDDETSRQSLAGLSGVYVLVEHIEDQAQRDGLLQDQIQTDVELKLRQAGITVLTQVQSFSRTGALLYVSVSALKNSSGFYAYNLDLELRQQVRLIRNPGVTVLATTWSATGRIGTVGSTRLSSLRDTVRDLTDQFINAYLAANPKR